MINHFVHFEDACIGYIERIDAMLGYPNPETKTLTYAVPVQHQSKKSKFMVIIKPVHAPALNRHITIEDIDAITTSNEIKKRQTHESLLSEGAFASPETF